jgi:hypothetical protein
MKENFNVLFFDIKCKDANEFINVCKKKQEEYKHQSGGIINWILLSN